VSGWDVHCARGDALFTVWAVLLQLYRVSARRVPRTRSRTHERPAPDRQRTHHETEPMPAVGEPIRGARRPFRVELARHQPLTFHSPQAVRKQLRRNTGQLGAEILESRGPPEQVAHDEEGPALADQIERFRDRAVLTVPLRHTRKYSHTGADTFVSSKK
jgi:hypothetical protein